MNNQYVQKIDVKISTREKMYQMFGYFLLFVALSFLMVAVIYEILFIIGTVLLVIIACVIIQLHNNKAKEYQYDFNGTRLIVSKKNILNRQKTILSLLIEDIIEYGLLLDLVGDSDIVAFSDNQSVECSYILFETENKQIRLIFEPDEYMNELFLLNLANEKIISNKIDYNSL